VTAVASVNFATVDEGQPFRLDASASTSLSGGALSYSWTQTAGPAVTIATPASAVLTLNAPEVTGNAVTTFQVNVTGASGAGQASVNVNVSNIAQTPVHATLPLSTTVTFPYPVADLLAASNEAMVGQYLPFAGGNIGFVKASAGPGGDITIDTSIFVGNSPPATTVFSVPPFGLGSEPFGLKFSVMREDLTVNPWFLFRTPLPGTSMFVSQIEKPCGVTWGSVDSGFGAYVGQRGKGFSAIRLNEGAPNQIFTSTYISVDAGKSFCVLSAPTSPIRGGRTFGGTFSTDVIAIDVDANTIYHYAKSATSPPIYELKETVPIQLNSTVPLKLVADAKVGLGGDDLALAFTDGQHRGTHRLVVVGFDPQHNIVQETHSWPVGVPSAVIAEDLDDDDYLEVAVICSTSPQAVVFESGPPPPGQAFFEFLPLSDARYVEIGLGATRAVSSLKRIFGFDALYVGYRDQKQVRAFSIP
jgi:hypothetical protein